MGEAAAGFVPRVVGNTTAPLSQANMGVLSETAHAKHSLATCSKRSQMLHGELQALAARHPQQLAECRMLRDDVRRASKKALTMQEENKLLRSRPEAALDRASMMSASVEHVEVEVNRLAEERQKLMAERERLQEGIKMLRDPAKSTESTSEEAQLRRRLTDC